MREFARHLSQLCASQGAREVPLRQVDKARWVAQCKGRAALKVSYSVYAFDPSVRAAFLDLQRGFFNGTSLCLRAEGHEAQAHRIDIASLPRGWQIATAMQPVRGAKQAFEASDYDELVDHPFELGTFWRGRFQVSGVPHEFVVAGAYPGFDGERLLSDAQRICSAGRVLAWAWSSRAATVCQLLVRAEHRRRRPRGRWSIAPARVASPGAAARPTWEPRPSRILICSG